MLTCKLIGPSLAAAGFALALAAAPAWSQGRNPPNDPAKIGCSQSPNEIDCGNAWKGPEHPQSSAAAPESNPSTTVGKVGCGLSPNEIDYGNAWKGSEHPAMSYDQGSLDSPEPNGSGHKPGHGP